MLVCISSLFHFITKQNSILWIYHNLSFTSCWTFGLFLPFCCHEQSCYGFCIQILVSYFLLCMLGIWLMNAENWKFVWFNVEPFYFCIVYELCKRWPCMGCIIINYDQKNQNQMKFYWMVFSQIEFFTKGAVIQVLLYCFLIVFSWVYLKNTIKKMEVFPKAWHRLS